MQSALSLLLLLLLSIHHLTLIHVAPTLNKVAGIDHIKELVQWSIENALRDGKQDHFDSGRLRLIEADGFQARHAPRDVAVFRRIIHGHPTRFVSNTRAMRS